MQTLMIFIKFALRFSGFSIIGVANTLLSMLLIYLLNDFYR